MRLIIILVIPLYLVAGELNVTVRFNRNDLKMWEYHGYTYIELPGTFKKGDVGAPSLPVAELRVLLPSGAELEKVEIFNTRVSRIPINTDIFPYQSDYENPYYPKVDSIVKRPEYYSRETFPDSLIVVKGTGIMAGFSIATFLFYPIIYHPLKKELEVIEEAEFKIFYKETKPFEVFANQKNAFRNVIKNLVINPEMINIFEPLEKTTKTELVDMVVITSDEFLPYFDTLKKHKEKFGLKTSIVSLNYIYQNYSGRDNPDKIRNFIRDWYLNRGLTYVILGGQADFENGHEIVPRRDIYAPAGGSISIDTIPCDFYYSAIDGTWDSDGDGITFLLVDTIDAYPDVFVGRLPARNVEQLQNIIMKIITYESNPPSGYLCKIILPASADSPPLYFTRVNDYIADLTPTPPWQDIKLYSSLGNLSLQSFMNAINNGAGFVNYATHGSPWCSEFFGVGDLHLMQNGAKLGIHTSVGCSQGAIHKVPGGDCFAESLVNVRTGGAVASIMRTVAGPMPEQYIHALYRGFFLDSIKTLGQAHTFGLISGTGLLSYWIFGDPSLHFYTDEPCLIYADYFPSIPVGDENFIVYTDAPGAIGSLWLRGRKISETTADNSGVLTFLVNYPIVPGDTLKVTIHKKNRLPFVGDIIVNRTFSPFVRCENVELTEVRGILNNRINPGERIRLRAMLANYGLYPASGVYAILYPESENVSILDNYAFYGTIQPGDSTFGADYFEFYISPYVVDRESIKFNLKIFYGNTQKSQRYSFEIFAPKLTYGKVEVFDSLGNMSGFPDPGETVTMVISVRNEGREATLQAISKMSSSDNRVRVITNVSYLGEIRPNELAQARFTTIFDTTVGQGDIIPFRLEVNDLILTQYLNFSTFVGVKRYETSFESDDYYAWSFEYPWDRRHDRFYHGRYSIGTGPYHENMNSSLYLPPFVAVGPCTLSLYQWVDLEPYYDFGYIECSVNNSSWVQIGERVSGRVREWKKAIRVISTNYGDTVRIRLRFTSDNGRNYEGWYIDSVKIWPIIELPSIKYVRHDFWEEFGNSNGVVDPGEIALLRISLRNGLRTVKNLTGTIFTVDTNIIIYDSISNYGNLLPLSVASGDNFKFNVKQSFTSNKLTLGLALSGNELVDTIYLTLPIGKFVGPCAYGYRVFTDMSPYERLRPNYNWIEINLDGTQVASSVDDVIETIQLPIRFKFFGEYKDRLTISSNGWVGFGTYTESYFENRSIFDSRTPGDIIAVFWDDLNPASPGSGKIYYYHDPTAHVFIIEYDSVYHYGSTSSTKVQLILFDSDYYRTPTGDGDILIQFYSEPGEADFTCGIKNSSGTDGIEYYFNGTYAFNADTIRPSRAIRFTTDTTGLVSFVREKIESSLVLRGLSKNPLRGIGFITFDVPRSMRVRLQILDIQGRVIDELLNENLENGSYKVKIDGNRFHHGVYFIRLIGDDNHSITQKFLITR